MPNAAEAHLLEAQWLDSITQPSIFEETSASPTESFPTSLHRMSSFLTYLLPSTSHASPVRAMTQGLIFAFFFPFIAGLAVTSEVLIRPPAFFDGEVLRELNREAEDRYTAVEADADADGNDRGESPEAEQSSDVVIGGEGIPRVHASGLITNSAGPGSAPRVLDIAMDPRPSLIFSPWMQTAIRAGLVLNFVTGFYLWLYAS